jgi:hypothetical protein
LVSPARSPSVPRAPASPKKNPLTCLEKGGSFTERKRRPGVLLTTWPQPSCILANSPRGPSPNSPLAKSPRPFPCWADKHFGKRAQSRRSRACPEAKPPGKIFLRGRTKATAGDPGQRVALSISLRRCWMCRCQVFLLAIASGDQGDEPKAEEKNSPSGARRLGQGCRYVDIRGDMGRLQEERA